jgi:hypothetical protein
VFVGLEAPPPVTAKLPVVLVNEIPFVPPLVEMLRKVNEPLATLLKLIACEAPVDMLIPDTVTPPTPDADRVLDKVGAVDWLPVIESAPRVKVAPAPTRVWLVRSV